MNIGTAIKTLRKKKGYSQKDFAKAIDISVNALCQIEINGSFPQKATIKKISEVLGVPPSYILFMSISEEDVPQDKRGVFNVLSNGIKELLLDSIAKDSSK